MAKVTIELTDSPSGGVTINLVTDPPIDEGTIPTPAHRYALSCLKGIAVDWPSADMKLIPEGADMKGA